MFKRIGDFFSGLVKGVKNLGSQFPKAKKRDIYTSEVTANKPSLVTDLAKSKAYSWSSINASEGSSEGSVVETPKDEAGVGLRTVVRPVVEVASRPAVQRQAISRGTLFEPAPDSVQDFEQHVDQHHPDFKYPIDFNPRVVAEIPPGYHVEATGTYVSGGGGSWSYVINALPVFIGQIRMAPVAPYGGTRGIHFRRWRVESISVVPGAGGGSLREA